MRGDLLTQPGRRHLSLTPLSFWVAMGMRQSFLQRLFQVFKGRQTSTFSPSDVSKFALQHSGEDACGIPDKDTIVLTGGQAHNFATRWKDILMSFTMFRGWEVTKTSCSPYVSQVLFDRNLKYKNIGRWLLSPFQGGVNWTKILHRKASDSY